MMVYKVTLDGGLLRDDVLLPAVRTLRAWEAEGKIEIFESDRAKHAAPVQATVPPRFRTVRKSPSTGPTFQRISSVLFPRRDSTRLNMTEVNDVAHLMRHHTLGHSIFVTTNTRDFIDGGKRERLQAAFQIVILTPDEAIGVLEQSGDWNASKTQRGS